MGLSVAFQFPPVRLYRMFFMPAWQNLARHVRPCFRQFSDGTLVTGGPCCVVRSPGSSGKLSTDEPHPQPKPSPPLDYGVPSELVQQLSSFYHCCWQRFLPQQLGICGLRPGLGASPLWLRIEAAASSTGSLLNAYLIFKKCLRPLQPSGLLTALKSLSVFFLRQSHSLAQPGLELVAVLP